MHLGQTCTLNEELAYQKSAKDTKVGPDSKNSLQSGSVTYTAFMPAVEAMVMHCPSSIFDIACTVTCREVDTSQLVFCIDPGLAVP